MTAKKEKTERSLVKCYNCGKRGHIAMNCPDNALFCDEGMGGAVTRKGKVEGKEADDILLDSRGRDGAGWGEDDGAGCGLRHFASVGAVGNKCAGARQTVES